MPFVGRGATRNGIGRIDEGNRFTDTLIAGVGSRMFGGETDVQRIGCINIVGEFLNRCLAGDCIDDGFLNRILTRSRQVDDGRIWNDGT